jgi:hypothetical protein
MDVMDAAKGKERFRVQGSGFRGQGSGVGGRGSGDMKRTDNRTERRERKERRHAVGCREDDPRMDTNERNCGEKEQQHAVGCLNREWTRMNANGRAVWLHGMCSYIYAREGAWNGRDSG